MFEWEITRDGEHVGWCLTATSCYERALELARDYQGDDVDVKLVRRPF